MMILGLTTCKKCRLQVRYEREVEQEETWTHCPNCGEQESVFAAGKLMSATEIGEIRSKK